MLWSVRTVFDFTGCFFVCFSHQSTLLKSCIDFAQRKMIWGVVSVRLHSPTPTFKRISLMKRALQPSFESNQTMIWWIINCRTNQPKWRELLQQIKTSVLPIQKYLAWFVWSLSPATFIWWSFFTGKDRELLVHIQSMLLRLYVPITTYSKRS